MKNKITVLGIFCALLAIGLGVVPATADAVFRGQDTTSLVELLKIKRATRKGVSVDRAKKTTGEQESRNFTEGVESRTLRKTTGQRVNYYTTTKKVSPQQKFKDFTVNNEFGFALKLPEGFEKRGDTLTATDGSVEFATTNSSVKIKALGNICEGGPVTLQDCLNKVSDAYTDDLLIDYPSARVLEKSIVKLRDSDTYRFEHKNAGKYFLMDKGDKRVAVLTFIDPLMKYLWRMEIVSPDNETGILSQGGVMNKIKESLFVEPEEKKNPISVLRRTYLKANNRLRSRYLGRRLNANETVSSKGDLVYEAENLSFQVAVPRTFHMESDSLSHASGELVFENGEGVISIKAMGDACVSQTQSIIRKCVESHATDVLKDLRSEHTDKTPLGVKNYQLRLTTNVSDLSVSRGEVLMSGADRVAKFVFAEPVYGHVWVMSVESNKGQLGVLGDARKMKNLLESMRFKK